MENQANIWYLILIFGLAITIFGAYGIYKMQQVAEGFQETRTIIEQNNPNAADFIAMSDYNYGIATSISNVYILITLIGISIAIISYVLKVRK